MNRMMLILLGLLAPALALASDGSFSNPYFNFSPPPQDYSVIFLGNIFGIVDGVLHGTGSQIMGTMFGVFNSAVLALGGIIIMYTLLVSTMNTAHEGQMLGQKWSSIWVPMRATLGFALLIPKGSGYCLMQIFVMWIVVQGVGAADKVWEAALSYLNRGGLIIQTQMDPTKSIEAGSSNDIASGAGKILSGQVCMLGLQAALENQRQNYLNSKQNGSGPCAGTPSQTMQNFCNTAVPDFLSTVNVVSVQNSNTPSPTSPNFTVPMPNFTDAPYSALNGICGSIAWNVFSGANNLTDPNNSSGVVISKSELQTTQFSRAIAIQQMYTDLAMVAQIMVNNDPLLNPPNTNNNNNQPLELNFSANAVQQFGVPLNETGRSVCSSSDVKSGTCKLWGADPTSTNDSSPLFNGTEFQGAVADYNGILAPALNLVAEAKKGSDAASERKFITDANNYGWILAGSYFFDLAKLNSASNMKKSGEQTDSDSGLGESKFTTQNMQNAFGQSSGQCAGPPYGLLCEWMNGDATAVNQVIGLIDGSNVSSTSAKPSLPSGGGISNIVGGDSTTKPETGAYSSTVYGFLMNSLMVNLAKQPGQTPPQFTMKFNMNFDLSKFSLPDQSFPCGSIMTLCIGRLMGNIFYNLIIKTIFNFFLNIVAQVINMVVMAFLSVPLLGMGAIFQSGVAIIQQPTVNPVIALANMGVNYINFANELWIILLTTAITTSLIPLFGIFIFALISMVFPLLFAWMAVMLSIGFVTAYYIPFLPYMIFTFGSIAWLMVVIEAMVAAPIVALGVTHPEGHDAFGKGEQAIMILLNVFLRPTMMIIGYIAAIALTYVSVWIINAGFANAMSFIQGSSSGSTWQFSGSAESLVQQASHINTTQGYTGWAGIYGFFFSILIYTTMYLIVVQKAFTLIVVLPDKVLRWIGGQPESVGQEAAQWGEEAKGQVGKAEGATTKAAQQIDSALTGYGKKAYMKATGALKGSGPQVGLSSDAGDSKPSKGG
ncbi:type IVB secretion system protein DotA [Legionella jamestowniensis]|uniref:DotA n=1 Tax=Legionella jamestowniensis TaxID=455 RepID=A0A0W0UYP4_9GAMM|nr:type IVB secretion system protein DotA [Legionella jamestowniensis]KTD12993.1 DotA [Legionella jamestowniensis]OCH98224.1 type IV secretion protein DotA [Legionella jamestowniensis]SFL79161.1 defect in organelle trafficking protein DotA [Legionella jamestowniensis DSM 19215]